VGGVGGGRGGGRAETDKRNGWTEVKRERKKEH
jgi:hypothetical protein